MQSPIIVSQKEHLITFKEAMKLGLLHALFVNQALEFLDRFDDPMARAPMDEVKYRVDLRLTFDHRVDTTRSKLKNSEAPIDIRDAEIK